MASLRVRLGLAIRRLRSQAGYSQERFADEAHLHRTYMSVVERGLANISLDNIEKIATALGMTAGALLTAADAPVGDAPDAAPHGQARTATSEP